MRLGEICNATWEDLNDRNNTLLIRDRKDPRHKKGNHMRIPLLDVSGYDARAILEEQRFFKLTYAYRLRPRGRNAAAGARGDDNAVMYKNPQCSCCESYANYLEHNGFKVEIKRVNNRSQIGSDAGVPADLEGCHTLMVDGYVVDGLVPVDVVKKLLTERPAITGITLAGMPAGAPGMGGEKDETWTIYAFTKDGKAPTVYATE